MPPRAPRRRTAQTGSLSAPSPTAGQAVRREQSVAPFGAVPGRPGLAATPERHGCPVHGLCPQLQRLLFPGRPPLHCWPRGSGTGAACIIDACAEGGRRWR